MTKLAEALKSARSALGAVKHGQCDFTWANKVIAEIDEALAQPQEANNFCPRCGKRTPDPAAIHTCTPPRGLELT